ncbi:MAG: hypothetical protein KIT14_21580 [bacterium]|nr:hypothetical protein [bacterium]
MQHRVVTALAGAAVGLGLLAAPLHAQSFNVPSKAKTLKGELVKAFDACTTPTDSTNPPVALPACSVSTPDTVCNFGSKGSGKFSTAVSKTDVKVSATLGGLDAGCEGQTLTAGANARVTTTDCQSGDDCTVVDLVGFPVGDCVVAKGKCKIKTTVEGAIGLGTNVFKDGEVVSIEILGVDVLRAGMRTFSSGLRIGPK